MNFGNFLGVMTLILMLCFVGITLWAYSSKRQADFDAASRLPLTEDDASPRRGEQ